MENSLWESLWTYTTDYRMNEGMNDVKAQRPYYTELYSLNIGGFYTIKIQLVFDGCNSWSYCLQHN